MFSVYDFHQRRSESESDHSEVEDDDVPGMQLNSMKAMKKAVSERSRAMMQRDSVFKKKIKIERAKNKHSAKKKKLQKKNDRTKKRKRRR